VGRPGYSSYEEADRQQTNQRGIDSKIPTYHPLISPGVEARGRWQHGTFNTVGSNQHGLGNANSAA